MSQLIFTCSSQQEYNDSGKLEGQVADTGPIGIEDPADYKNNLQNTITIPPRSEVAVVQVEINRQDKTCIPADGRFYLYLGKKLDNANWIDSVQAIPYPCRRWVSEEDDSVWDQDHEMCFTPIEFAAEIERILNNSICHPDQYRTSTCVLNDNGDQMKITIENHGNQKARTMNMGVTDYDADPKVQAWYLANVPNDDSGAVYDDDGKADARFIQVGDGNEITRTKATGADVGAWWDDECVLINRNAPISWNQGAMILEIKDAVQAPFAVGLVRPSVPEQYIDGPNYMEPLQYLRPDHDGASPWSPARPFCDFQVVYAHDNAAGGGKMKIYVYEVINTDNHIDQHGNIHSAPVTTREVQYWDAGGAGGRPTAQIDEDDLIGGGGANYTAIRFQLFGNRLDIMLGKSSDPAAFDGSGPGTDPLKLCCATNDTGLTTTNTCAPLTQNHWALYPFLNLSTEDQIIEFTKYGGMTYNGLANRQADGDNADLEATYNFPLGRTDVNNPKGVGHDDDLDGSSVVGGSSWVGWGIENYYEGGVDDEEGYPYEFLYQQCERFSWRDPASANFNLSYWVTTHGGLWTALDTIKGMDASSATVPEAANWVNALIFHEGDNDNYKYDLTGVYATVDDLPPNMGKLFGMPHKNLVQTIDGITSKLDGTAGVNFRAKWAINDQAGAGPLGVFDDDPELALVNCETLTHQTYNFCRNVPSKFLYCLPRYDSRGNNNGRMFHEVKDRCYVTLNNPDPIVLNDLRTRITDKNGVTIKDLQGATAVVYHIRGEQPKDIVTGG